MVKPDGQDERLRRQRSRNWAILGALVVFVIMIYVISIVRMGGA